MGRWHLEPGASVRVIAGAVGGRRLRAPSGGRTRPTSDRVKEALFSALAPRLAGARVLDLYAGSGALGIEALSRGARQAVFVEQDRQAAAVIARNLADLGLEDGHVRALDVARYGRVSDDGPFDVVLADPPYEVATSCVGGHVAQLHASGRLAPAAVVVIERRGPATAPPRVPGVTWDRTRAYGDTVLLWGRVEEER